MDDEDPMAVWRALVGDSDDDDGNAFHGFTVEEVMRGDGSDVDLDSVVQAGHSKMTSDVSDDNFSDGSANEDRGS